MSHPSEEQLAHFASESSFDEREQLQAHIETCAQCGGAVENYGELISTLSSEETWASRESERSSSVASIVRFDVKWSTEKAEAAALMNRLKDVDPADWPLDEFPRTTGMVLEMQNIFRFQSETSPRTALSISEAAECVAGGISEQMYSADAILQLRGKVAKEKSRALRYLGRFEEALESLDLAEALFVRLAMPDFDLATVAYNRASVLGEIDRYDEALDLIAAAEATFLHFGVARRVAHSRIVRANLLYSKGSIEEARTIFSLVLSSPDLDRDTVPTALLNLACCNLELGDFHQAHALSHRATKLLESTVDVVAARRARWALGRALLGLGQHEEGLFLLHAVANEFRELGMLTDASLVVLYIVEHLLARDDHEGAERLCSTALEHFVRSRMPTAAANAMAHLRDLAGRREAGFADVEKARSTIAEHAGPFQGISM